MKSPEAANSFPELANFREEEDVLTALEEDLKVDLSESKAIPKEEKEDLRDVCTSIAGKIIDEFGRKQGYLSIETQEWLLDLAKSALLVSERDFQLLLTYAHANSLEDGLGKRVLLLRLKTGQLGSADIGDSAFTWSPFSKETAGSSIDQIQFIFFKRSKAIASVEGQTRQALLQDIAAEELLHALDRMTPQLAEIDNEAAGKICHAAVHTYGLVLLPEWLVEEWKHGFKEEIEGWRRLEDEFGEDFLKRAYFKGVEDFPYVRLMERAKAILSV